jgi:hypothetical protein
VKETTGKRKNLQKKMTKKKKPHQLIEFSATFFSVPPSRRNSSNVVFVRGFVRPFTKQAVKDLIDQFGRVLEWGMDAIKSRCYIIVRSPQKKKTKKKKKKKTNKRNSLTPSLSFY